ncbi:fam-l protein [Plasmodium brasilianum]|uniref:Fam-l protein n=1 Tax=Plasmodium brasilianum TaxID=5824 RepID=A0ACB9YFK5_PLABR|nr:fam-l protein [Plasmodium brasilianum]
MEQKINSIFFFKFFSFFLLIWRLYFNNNISTHSKLLKVKYNININLSTRTYRSLTKYKQDKHTNILALKEIHCNGVNQKNDIYNNEKRDNVKYIQLTGSSLNEMECHKQTKKNKSYIFETKKCSRSEKKIFKELDYINFLKNNKTISNKLYNKIIRKKYGLKITSPLIFLLLFLVVFILDLFVGYGFIKGLFKVFTALKLWDGLKPFYSFLMKSPFKSLCLPVNITKGTNAGKKYFPVLDVFFVFLIYILPFLILGALTVLRLIYYHKKVKKYDKIKFRKG